MWYFQGARRKRRLLSEHLALVRLVRLVLLEMFKYILNVLSKYSSPKGPTLLADNSPCVD